jgi:hypothetical protein
MFLPVERQPTLVNSSFSDADVNVSRGKNVPAKTSQNYRSF